MDFQYHVWSFVCFYAQILKIHLEKSSLFYTSLFSGQWIGNLDKSGNSKTDKESRGEIKVMGSVLSWRFRILRSTIIHLFWREFSFNCSLCEVSFVSSLKLQLKLNSLQNRWMIVDRKIRTLHDKTDPMTFWFHPDSPCPSLNSLIYPGFRFIVQKKRGNLYMTLKMSTCGAPKYLVRPL